jgi:hypothetical protein
MTKEPAVGGHQPTGNLGSEGHRKLGRIDTRNTRHLDPGSILFLPFGPYGGCSALGPNDIDGTS